ncbi:MAG: hypothetical protein GY739_19430 [Mesoflavibacter sp.]|nr:hypothetical protein [Mesoflavibacter sp.]
MISQELEKIRSKLTHKQHLYLTALISGKSEAEARKAAGYNRPPKSPLLKKAINIFQKEDLEKSLTEREKAINFHLKDIEDLDQLFKKVDYNNIKLDPVAIIKEKRFLRTEINKLQGLYIEKEEEKEGITKEEEEALIGSVLEECKNSI